MLKIKYKCNKKEAHINVYVTIERLANIKIPCNMQRARNTITQQNGKHNARDFCNSPKLLSKSVETLFGERGRDGCNTRTTFDDEYSSRRSLVVIL